MLRIWFWVFQAFYFLIASVVPLLAWMNKLQFRAGQEVNGKIAVTVAMTLVFICSEVAMRSNWKRTWKYHRIAQARKGARE
jgi:hypothetical protein